MVQVEKKRGDPTADIDAHLWDRPIPKSNHTHGRWAARQNRVTPNRLFSAQSFALRLITYSSSIASLFPLNSIRFN